MKIYKRVTLFLALFMTASSFASDLSLEDVYACIPFTSDQAYWVDLNQQILETSILAQKKRPEVSVDMYRTSQLQASSFAQSPSYIRLGIQQNIYDKKLNREVASAEANLEAVRWKLTSQRIEEAKIQFQAILNYYQLIEEKKVLTHKAERLSRLVSILKDLVASKITDGVLLLMSESDLRVLEIQTDELNLKISKIQKSLLGPRKIVHSVQDGTIYKLANQVASTKKYSRFADKSKISFLESQQKVFEIQNAYKAETLLPRLTLGANYFNYFESSEQLPTQNEMVFSLQLTMEFSDFFNYTKFRSNQTSKISHNHSLIVLRNLESENNDSYNLERMRQIDRSIDQLGEVKVKIGTAKDILSKKLLMNKATYSDYISADDKLDEIEYQIVSLHLEKIKLVINNDIGEFFSSSSSVASRPCSFSLQ